MDKCLSSIICDVHSRVTGLPNSFQLYLFISIVFIFSKLGLTNVQALKDLILTLQ